MLGREPLLDRLLKARQAADESFREAWRAVDTFTQLSEEEFKSKPQQFQVRRRFLATALEFYNNFLDQRRDDPTVSDELAATTKQVEQLMHWLHQAIASNAQAMPAHADFVARYCADMKSDAAVIS